MEQVKECQHTPEAGVGFVGKVVNCALCGASLVYNNRPAGSKVRMSKKERRAMKRGASAIDKMIENKGDE